MVHQCEICMVWINKWICLLNYSQDVKHRIYQGRTCQHRRLQSCVDTQARLDYAAFDEQLWKRIVTTLYAIRTSVLA